MIKIGLGATCLLVLCGIVVAGLWPFHAPRNEVIWLKTGYGLLFGDYGSIMSSGNFKPMSTEKGAPISVEVCLEPSILDDSNTILAFYSRENSLIPFSLHQSLSDLVVEGESLDRQHHVIRGKLFIANVFSQKKGLSVTVTSGSRGTRIYLDGVLTKVSSEFLLTSEDLIGKLIIANSPTNNDSWSGRLSGLAIYHTELTAEQVLRHYKSSTKAGRQDPENENAVALYHFNEGKGTVVHNQVDSATDLMIPERYFVLRGAFLAPPWKEYYSGWGYWKNIGINIVGFIPLGLFFCLYFTHILRTNRALAATAVVGFLISLTIEVSQAFLPTRDSGMTDLITNTFGTFLGAVFSRTSMVQTLWTNLGRLTHSDFAMVRARQVPVLLQNEQPK
jgi:hypothetical protein